MAELMPALSHLQPPYIQSTQVRLHRFSPLFVGGEALGFKDVVPSPAHHEIFPFPAEVVARLAYFFDHGFADHPEPNSYIGPLAAAVKRWHQELGQAVFIAYSRGDTLKLIDTRAVASQPAASLTGLERDLLLACTHGASLRQLCRALQTEPARIQPTLDAFVDRRWILALDDAYLALPTPADAHLGALGRHLPQAILEEALLRRFRAQMEGVRQGTGHTPSSASLERFLERTRAPS
jgi:hypothetical protein